MVTDPESTSGRSSGRSESARGPHRRERAATERDRRSTWRRIRRGAEGGALATAVMTVYRLPVTRSLPPSAEFWTQFVAGGSPDDHPLPALVLHVVYGVVAGTVFAAAFPSREPVAEAGYGPPSPSGEVKTTLIGLAYGLALSWFGERVMLDAVLDVDPDDRFAFHVGHVLYGITLGAWVGTRTREE